jgi:uncharacterized protein YbjT (DUF2867 family)
MNEQLTALVIGATGATGKELVNQLLEDSNYSEVKIFVRKKSKVIHPKLQEFLIDFDNIEAIEHEIKGDVLFSALGTTIKIAKTKEIQYKIDFSYQLEFAKIAAKNEVKNYVLISAYGANASSSIFYSRMKGELEEAVKSLNFKKIHIFQPGILDRNTDDNRTMEKISLKVIRFLNKIGLFQSQKPMPVKILAKKMIDVNRSKSSSKINYYKLDQIFKI